MDPSSPANPIALWTRRSQRDSRVTLVTLANDEDAPEDGSSSSNAGTMTSAPSTPARSSRSRRSHPIDATPQSPPSSSSSFKRQASTGSKRIKRELDASDDAAADEGEYTIEQEEEEEQPVKAKIKKRSASSASASPRKSSPTKLRAKLVEPHPEPQRWRETYEIIRKQREGIVAAVDLMGCDAIAAHKDEAHVTSDKDRRLASLISLMLSSQTRDPVTHEATMNLKRNLEGGLCLEGILSATDAEIQACINKVGFWRRKTEYIRKTAEILRDRFEGDVPKTIEDLLILPGVGPKMGFLCLQAAWGIQDGIGVDTHVHRITNRLGWHRKPTTDPEETRVNLESWLPKEYHNHINIMLVGLGQTICLPVNPRCDLCHLGQMDDSPCPSKRKQFVKQALKATKEEEEEEVEPFVTTMMESTGTAKVQVGEVADSLLQVEETESKPIIDIKVESVLGPRASASDAGDTVLEQVKASPYFVGKPAQLSW